MELFFINVMLVVFTFSVLVFVHSMLTMKPCARSSAGWLYG